MMAADVEAENLASGLGVKVHGSHLPMKLSKIFQYIYSFILDVWENIVNVASFLKKSSTLKNLALSTMQLKRKKRITQKV